MSESEARKELLRMLVGTFGYEEVEREIVERCIAAIKVASMDPLRKDLKVFCKGKLRDSLNLLNDEAIGGIACSGPISMKEMFYSCTGEVVVRRIKEAGIWQYVEELIAIETVKFPENDA